jgi:phytoene dehydrogenase-like protein
VSTHDVAVIGAGLAGLTAAAYLSASGKKVIVLDPSPEPGGVLAAFERSGYLFPACPSLARGFGPEGPYRSLFGLLGIPLPGSEDGRRYQIALPDHRIAVAPDAGETLEELRREYSREIDALARLYGETGRIAERNAGSRVATALSRRRTTSEFIRSYGLSRELSAFFDVQARFFHGVPLAELSLAAFADMIQSPPRSVPGSYHGLAARLRNLIVGKGGECRFGEPWPAIRFHANRIAALGTSREIIEPRAVILNASPETTLHNLYLGMQADGIPVGMQATVLALSSYERPGDILSLSWASAEEGQVPAPGLRAVTASWRRADGTEAAPPPALPEQVRSVMPFYEDFCVLSREEDFSARRFPLPAAVRLKPARAGIIPSSVRNLLLVPDGAPAERCIQAAAKVADKLS